MMGSASSTHDDIVATLKDAGLDPAQVRTLIEATFAEDLRWGPDVTTEAIFGDERATAQVVSRAHGTLAGVPVGAYALQFMAPYSPAHRLTSQGSHETQVHV
ncbi:nicotinate-nucleotide pyrophosphorylase, partial [Cutibacterium granulosum DSM 20700]